MTNLDKYKRIGDLLISLDEVEMLYDLKLTGESSLQFFHKELEYLTNVLKFDLHTTKSGTDLNELRKKITIVLPKLIQQRNFSIDYKKTKLTSETDHYIINDNQNKFVVELIINYLNRSHILPPEYFARIDKVFFDLHINSLATIENYGRYFAELDKNFEILYYLVDNNKILPQQIPFIRKIMVFYIGVLKTNINFDKVIKNIKDDKYLKFLNELFTLNENEEEFLKLLNNNIFSPSLILPKTLVNNVLNHPRIRKFEIK